MTVYEHREAMQKLAITQMAVAVPSFLLTWHLVWWETLFSLAVAVLGYVAGKAPVHDMTLTYVTLYYYGNGVAIGLQALALIALLYQLVESHVVASALGLNEIGSVAGIWVFFTCLIALVCIHFAISCLAYARTLSYRAELQRNGSQQAYEPVSQLPQGSQTTL